jgi:pyruvate/2-oxoglutarate dehydrogenase complex dihydrolipoamide dehydrogenase (E3) component
MAGNTSYDVLIIGGGQAGIPLSYGLAKAGKRVGLAERKDLGGSCVNFGCTPTKAVIASARVAHLARRAADFGLNVSTVEVDFPAVLRRAKDTLIQLRRGLEQGFENSENPRLLRGDARIEGRAGKDFRVRVAGGVLTAGQLVIDTGTRSLIPPIEGMDSVDFMHAENWLDRPELPECLAIVGGGYIGLEMSQFYRRMGSRLIVIEESGQIASHEDEDVVAELKKYLEGEGIEFRLNARVKRVERNDNGLRLTLEGSDGSTHIEASHLFVATGRKPNTDEMGLETIGVRVSNKGIVEVNKQLATNVDGVWVAGDIRGGPMFTHTSWDDYRVLMSQMVGDGSRTTERAVPYAIFTDPELGRVSMTEWEAREAGKQIKVARFEMRRNSKARELGEPAGFIKVVVDAETNRILGAAVLAVDAAELVHLYVDLINAGLPYTVMRDAIYIHPTLAEAVQSAVSLFG